MILWPAVLSSADRAGFARLRSAHPRIAQLIAEAAERSSAFHNLMEALARTDGIVYVIEQRCGHGVRACVPHWMTRAGASRVLRILIDPHDAAGFSRERLAGVIAHELHHAVELLSDTTVIDSAAMFRFYGRDAPRRGAFETPAAGVIGSRVWREMKAAPHDPRSASAR
jgi:hypothetical protein